MEQADLKALVENLLMHQMDPHPLQPELVLVTDPRDGWHAIALVIDGWYAMEADARGEFEGWYSALKRLRTAMLDDKQPQNVGETLNK